MATAYENLVTYLKTAIRQLEQSTKMETEIDEDEVWDLMSQLSDLMLKLLE